VGDNDADADDSEWQEVEWDDHEHCYVVPVSDVDEDGNACQVELRARRRVEDAAVGSSSSSIGDGSA
jgi:hypothetical protein